MLKFSLFCMLLLIGITSFSQKRIPPEKPKLVVGIVVSQMRYDYIQRYWSKLSDHGIKRLINEGSFCKNTNHDYMFTQTSVGHASIFTGTTPSAHGIISDVWYERNKNELISCTEDLKTNPVGTKWDGARRSPALLLTSTIGDEMKTATQNKSKVISVALIDHAAVLSGGHAADGAFWFDDISGDFITSSYYKQELPKWVLEFNKKKYPDIYLEKVWNTLEPIQNYTESIADLNPYEAGFGEGKTVFPYNLPELSALSKNKKNYAFLKSTPWGNTYVKDFALSAIINEEMGKDDITDLLICSFSALEYIGLRFGPASVEVQDAFLRLDKEIEFILKFIDEYLGKENVMVFFTSDHGVSHIPDYLKDLKIPSGTFNHKLAMSLLKSYLTAIYGNGNWLKGYNEQQVFLNTNIIEDSKVELKDIQEKTANFLVQMSGVANTVTAYNLQNTNFTDGIFAKIQNSYNQKRSGDVIINLLPGYMEEVYMATTHNSAYNYDTHVPLMWYGWKVRRETITTPISVTDIAPTISDMLKIAHPNGSSGNIIQGVVVQ